MTPFIDMDHDDFGVKAICCMMCETICGFITSRAYRVAKTRPASARALRDQSLIPKFKCVHEQNYSVYGARKMRHAMRRAGRDLGPDQVARLMRTAGLHGVRRGRKLVTARPTTVEDLRPDLFRRDFTTPAPHEHWVADITYVRFLSGFCYVAFISDVCTRKIVGWAMDSMLHTEHLPLLALEHALLTTGARRDSSGSPHHSDQASQYVSLAYSDAVFTAGVTASVGAVGDSYNNALAKAVNGLYKTEIIYSRHVLASVTAVETATLDWVHWWNTVRLHEGLGYRSPAEVDAAYAEVRGDGIRGSLTSERNPGRFN